MKIAEDDIEIDGRVGDLLERGLLRYGEGDLEGALSHWKHALILDPENEKAAHYAKYVEDNHDLADARTSPAYDPQAELTYPFGLEELGTASLEGADDYESFEISSPGPAEEATLPVMDDGWNVDEGWVSELVAQGDAVFEVGAVHESGSEAAVGKDESDFSELSLDDGIDLAPSGIDLAPSTNDEFEQPEAKTTPATSIATAFDDFELAGYQGLAQSAVPERRTTFDDGSVDEELTVEHFSPEQRPFGRRNAKGLALPDPSQPSMGDRAPTQDPGLASVPLRVDEALLSLEDSTGEIALGDLRDLQRLSEEATRPVFVAVASARRPEALILPDTVAEALTLPDAESLASGGLSLDIESPVSGGLTLPDTESPASSGLSSLDVESPASDDFALLDPVASASGYFVSLDPVAPASISDSKGSEPVSNENVIARIQQEASSIDEAERTLFIVQELVQFACSSLANELDSAARETASEAVMFALSEADDSAACQKLIFTEEEALTKILIRGLCELDEIPELVVPLTDIPFDEIDNRAAFLMTRIDGTLTLEEILDISGMPKLEALRHLERVHSLRYLRVL